MKTLFFTVIFYLLGYYILQTFSGGYEEVKWQYAYYFWDKLKDFLIFLSVYSFIPYLIMSQTKVAFVKALTLVMLLVTALRFCFEVFDCIGSTNETMLYIRIFFQYNIILIAVSVSLFAVAVKRSVLKRQKI